MSDVTDHDLQAYADGNLPDERRAAVAAWLAAHPEDAERIESYRRIGEELGVAAVLSHIRRKGLA